jgi:DNA-binding transcriptional ArsR family regulator
MGKRLILLFEKVLNRIAVSHTLTGCFGLKMDRILNGQQMKDMMDPFALMTHDDEIERASRSMKAMAHPLRLKILCTLGEEELSVQDIVEKVGTTQSNISQHLGILKDKGILASRKDANRVYYRVSDARTLRLIGMMRDVFCTFSIPR